MNPLSRLEEGSTMHSIRKWSPFAVGAALILAATPAFSQMAQPGFAIDRFDPSERGSDWFVLESVDWSGKARPAFGLVADFANKPLVQYDEDGEERFVIIENQLFFHLGGSLALGNMFRAGVSVPIGLAQSGDLGMIGESSFPPPDSAALGDVRLSGDLRVVGGPGRPFNLGIGVSVFLPTGKRDQYSGDEELRLQPHLLVGGRGGNVQYGLKAGFHYRGLEDTLDQTVLGSEVFAAAALGVRVAKDKVLIGPELYGSTVVSDSDAMFERRTTPLEALLGAHVWLGGGWKLRGGVAFGLSRGVGSPLVRGVAGLEWVQTDEPPPPDRDRDGVLDREDACPDVPGVRTDDPKTNGCPAPTDRDGDGVIDPEDACPDVPGVRTDDPATNGCPPPPPDRDGDGIIDAEDACPDVPGVKTDDPKTNGCPPPPPDRDGDTVLDPDDACPDVPGLVTTDPKTNGCPPARIEKAQIIIVEQIKFKFNSAVILPESETILLAVREILATHPEITKVRVEGHTDNKGKARYNKRLSQRRAQAVVKWLVKSGIAKKRLYSIGYGMERPIDTNDTEEGRQNNRRVEFHIEQGAEAPPAP
jgi:OOP family OmpA-OmpF porin